MSVKAYNRGSQNTSRQIDAEVNRSNFTKADEIRAGRMLDKINNDMARMEAENSSLKAELEKARSAYHLRNSELVVTKDELRDVQKSNDFLTETCSSLVRALEDSRKGHSKLTAVMKIALTPEQYHSARASAADVYPELFAKEEK
jgi:septation ring formation regulator EzrA